MFFSKDDFDNLHAAHAMCIIGAQKELLHMIDSREIDVECTNVRRETLLFTACSVGQASVAEQLLSRHANIHALDMHGRSPLFVAVSARSLATVRILIAHGADLSTRDYLGRTARQIASDSGDVKLASLLDAVPLKDSDKSTELDIDVLLRDLQ